MEPHILRQYKTARWSKLREAQLAAEPLCAICEQDGRVAPATVCDHVIPHRGDIKAFWRGPFQSLCRSCHSSVKQSVEKRGYDTRVDASGWPIDPNHPAYRTR